MLKLDSIVCPVDFSDESAAALRWAAALMMTTRARLTVVTAVDPLLAEAARVRLDVDLPKTDADPALREFVRNVLTPDFPLAGKVTVEARVGEPFKVILEAAAREAADLIAMGTHGLGGLQKLLLGSTAERVLRATTRPVLTIPGGAVPPADVGTPGLALARIVIGTDFSEASSAALAWSIDLAQFANAILIVCHVVAASSAPVAWRARVSVVEDQLLQQARERLTAVTAQIGGTVQYETVLPLGRPADALATIAEERGADLIVLGLFSEPDTGQRPGSIAYRVVSLAQRPVLVVPPRA